MNKSPRHHSDILDRRGRHQVTARPDSVHARFSRPDNCLSDLTLISPQQRLQWIEIPKQPHITHRLPCGFEIRHLIHRDRVQRLFAPTGEALCPSCRTRTAHSASAIFRSNPVPPGTQTAHKQTVLRTPPTRPYRGS
ncbi:MAG: hypothetical protein MZV64_19000 [Ignavibacteriales bacterium]|nr:hypothetical protein [Ignavibacteriales bacterium]